MVFLAGKKRTKTCMRFFLACISVAFSFQNNSEFTRREKDAEKYIAYFKGKTHVIYTCFSCIFMCLFSLMPFWHIYTVFLQSPLSLHCKVMHIKHAFTHQEVTSTLVLLKGSIKTQVLHVKICSV